jgi:hypothetical protein
MITWKKLQICDLGFLPSFFSEDDPRTAAEQLNEAYIHGGGYMPMKGWKNPKGRIIEYPGDKPLYPSAIALLRDETLVFYAEGSWLGIFQPNGNFAVTRVD